MTSVYDRTVRGIAWGNRYDRVTVWLKKGKFSHELPNETTAQPTHIISDIGDVVKLF